MGKGVYDVVVVTTDDWVAVYHQGRKVVEGHSLTPLEVLRALGISCRGVYAVQGEVEAGAELDDLLETGEEQ